ncbi:deoxyribodipyrimidine photo-lyase [Verrucomicrobium sp. GAS474]|uniref:cryptochrome/photolyase family protein n=1 Tax=Verrucomicrobium sp. GAS474 TaxID=1882831 RepID=UPI000879CD27|nr:deoxyribodipyrimidine photo-lyase [Verrucomicrobium sp. GAS474]SDU03295.1 deoxyribodipyrimidine photo-lyase [Verrucomicrobium sp. GAS474]
MPSPALVWFRADLRLADNPALQAALARGGPVIPVYIDARGEEEAWAPGGASRWWLHHSLQALGDSLRERGSRLVIREGASLGTLQALLKETGAEALFWNRRYEPALIARDTRIKETLRKAGHAVETFNAALLHEPWTIANQSGKPFQVFTPFWKHALGKADPAAPLPAPDRLPAPKAWPESIPLAALELEPTIPWHHGLAAAWHPGEAGAAERVESFLLAASENYAGDRDRPDLPGTSRLSPHLHFGEIGPRQIWHAYRRHAARIAPASPLWRGSRYLTEIGWREFSHHLLYHFPHTAEEPLREPFAAFPWVKDKARLRAWQKGLTGYPVVDAGMRELWATGWMHNRVRMIAASFLVKDLLISWREGAAWFWETLVDADLAQNTLGWQWSAGCGADASPYFRIFNPVTQGEKFDPLGRYVRRWCPELAGLPGAWLHRPWEAPGDLLARAGIVLGRDYPKPIVDHAVARKNALAALSSIRTLET